MDVFIFPFGKHKGERIDAPTVPRSYLEWIVRDKVYQNKPDLETALINMGFLDHQDSRVRVERMEQSTFTSQGWRTTKRPRVNQEVKGQRDSIRCYQNEKTTGISGLDISDELKAILEQNLQAGECMKIIAAAGAGKTTALIEYASRRKVQRFIYVVFNKDMAQAKEWELAQAGTCNVLVKTFHSIAYNATIDHRPKFDERKKGLPVSAETCGGLKADVADVRRTLKKFITSSDRNIEAHHVPSTRRSVPAIVGFARQHWSKMMDPACTSGVAHDAYLKLFQLRADLQAAAFQEYDCLMLDEAHDCSASQLAIFAAQPLAKVLVLDPHQCIYQFRGARAESMDAIQATVTLPLNRTFRFGQELADAAAALVRHFKRPRCADFRIDGRPGRSTPVRLLDEEASGRIYDDFCTRGAPLTALARYNRTLFEEALRCVRGGAARRIGFLGGVDAACGGLDRLSDLFWLRRGQPERVRSAALKGYGSLDEVLAACEEDSDDDGLRAQCLLVEQSSADIPACVEEIRRGAVSPREAQVLFATAREKIGRASCRERVCQYV